MLNLNDLYIYIYFRLGIRNTEVCYTISCMHIFILISYFAKILFLLQYILVKHTFTYKAQLL